MPPSGSSGPPRRTPSCPDGATSRPPTSRPSPSAAWPTASSPIDGDEGFGAATQVVTATPRSHPDTQTVSRLGAAGPSAGADRRRRRHSRHLVAGRPQQRGRMGAGPRRRGVRDARSSGSSARRSSCAGPGSGSQRPGGRHRRAARSRCGRGLDPPAGAPGRPAGTEAFVGPVGRRRPRADGDVTLLPARRGVHDTVTARRRHGRAVRAAVVDPPGRSAAPFDPSRRPPPRASPCPCRCGPNDRAGDSVERAPADAGEPRGAAPTGPATTGATSTGGRRPTPAS